MIIPVRIFLDPETMAEQLGHLGQRYLFITRVPCLAGFFESSVFLR